MKKIIKFASMLFISIAFLVSCGKPTNKDKVLKIGYPASKAVLTGAPGIAQSKGFIEEELRNKGYEVEYKSFSGGGPAVNEALAAGELDVVIYADFPGIVSKANGVDTSLIAIYDNFINAAIVVLADSPIKDVNDLRGKKIGFAKGTYMHKYIYQVLQKYSIDLKEVELINTSEGDSALQSGTIDALVVTDTSEALSVLTKKVARTIDSTINNKDFSGEGIVIARNNYISENKEAVISLLKAIEKGKEYFVKNPEECYKILTNSGQSYEATKSLYNKDNEKFDYITINISEDSKGKLQETKKFLLDNNLIKKDFEIENWINRSLYEESIK